MRSFKLIVVLAVALGFMSLGWAVADTAAAASQTACPVLNGKVDKKVYTDYQGKRVYFCCSGCIDNFKKDPAKYMKKMEESGVTPEDAPK